MCVCYLGNPHGHDPLIEAGLILSTQVFDVFTLLLDLRVLSKEKIYITKCSTDITQSKTGLIRSYRCSTDKTQSKTQASLGHRRGSWNLLEIGTLEIHNLTLHYCVRHNLSQIFKHVQNVTTGCATFRLL